MIAQLRHVSAGDLQYDVLQLWCPGCDGLHQVRVTGPETQSLWQWDGNIEAPTISPSILVSSSRPNEHGDMVSFTKCHSFFKAGAWEFLDDCVHELRGTVPAVPLPEWLMKEN